MRASFTNFWRRNRAAARLAILSQLEYRVNFLIDATVQPVLGGLVEAALWSGILRGMDRGELGGFGREFYLAYALWSTYVGRVTANWSYEFQMLDEIDTGRVNTVLVRPISFYEFYLSQFLGYKALVGVTSIVFPAWSCWYFGLPFHPERLPLAALLIFAFLLLTHTLSFMTATFAFYMNRAQSLSMIKNLAIWVLAGEMIPLDLYPEPLRGWLIWSPFSAGAYVPVSYLTGRIGTARVLESLVSVAIWGALGGIVATLWWRRGVKAYTGTGA